MVGMDSRDGAISRLKTFPVGLKLLEDVEDLNNYKWLRRPTEKLSLCQLITIVRTFDWTIGGTAEDLATPGCTYVLGLSQLDEFVTSGEMRSKVWLEETGRCQLRSYNENPVRKV